MRSILVLLLLAAGTAGCAGRMEAPQQPASAAPQPQPGSMSARMGGDYTWMATIRGRSQ